MSRSAGVDIAVDSKTQRELPPLRALAEQANRWLCDAALPLWSTHGFDRQANAFQEQLAFDAAPLQALPRRLMVQARQVATFAAAALSARHEGGAHVTLLAARQMLDRYHRADGQPGWLFSVDAHGRVLDARRDLYGHAFALFALAWVMRIERDPRFVSAVTDTLDFIDAGFFDAGHGGYWDELPRTDALRRQNPHMHLFEALIALYETTRREDVLDRCRSLHALFIRRFFDASSGFLYEYFNDDWSVHPLPGKGSVEPGHLFEWAWLLRRYEAISGECQDGPVDKLIKSAMIHGLDARRGRVVDEIAEDGSILRGSSRLWPHAEALKALSNEAARGTIHAPDTISSIFVRLRDVYFRSPFNGGWIDHVDAEDQPINKTIPASTLYHIYFGIVELHRSFSAPVQSMPE